MNLSQSLNLSLRLDLSISSSLDLSISLSYDLAHSLYLCTSLAAICAIHQYQVVGRALPMETDQHPKIYRMKLWATNEVRAKSKFWYFLRKLKKVSEMKAEYFPPKVDIILQNEIPTDFYILVSGAVYLKGLKNELLEEMPFVKDLLDEFNTEIPEDARSNAWVSFDGKRRQQLSRGDSVRISMSQHPLPIVNKSDSMLELERKTGSEGPLKPLRPGFLRAS
ncbi:60S ribosomal protein L18a [Camellia lanceoleosa]|uniref:60S ribosomal protein L18a n=1 Tax=Camellia lanceoleosa TaxID=1840588 RepID=A0ACC0FQD2_9ERIC|nr:60S ribosomal protein L18a [Camellia lanceoleosa]